MSQVSINNENIVVDVIVRITRETTENKMSVRECEGNRDTFDFNSFLFILFRVNCMLRRNSIDSSSTGGKVNEDTENIHRKSLIISEY